MSKRTQRRADQRRLTRLNREQTGAAMLAKQAPTGRPETVLAKQAPTGRPETVLAKQAPTGRPETVLAKQAPTGRPETVLAKQAPTGRPETVLAKQAPTARPEIKFTTSEAQIAANRENSTHSTGPTSDAGKAIVSQNRTVHGLNYNPNTFRVLTCEDQSAYDDLLNQLTTEHKPTETHRNHCSSPRWPNTAGSSTEPTASKRPASTSKPPKSPIKSSSPSTSATQQPTSEPSTSASMTS